MPHHSLTAIIKQVNQQQWRKKTTKKNRIIDILPYENTYGQYYYPDQLVTIEQTMIDKIVHGVQAMATALTNSKDTEDALNGITMLADPSFSPHPSSTNNKITDKLTIILADNRLNGKTNIFHSESGILSRMIRKILLCTQLRTLCSYGDIITAINNPNYHQIRLRTSQRMSLSSDEFIEILGEIYHTSYNTVEVMKYYLEAHDIIDLDTTLIHPSILTSKQIDDMIKYIAREDAIRQVVKLIFNQKSNTKDSMINEHIQFNELYQTIKKLNPFMSADQAMNVLRRSYSTQLKKRSKTKPITANDLHTLISQTFLLPEHFEILIAENIITSETLCQFYIDFHAKEDIDERLQKVTKKIHDHLNMHSCVTRIVLKMIADHSNGTLLTPFLDEFNKIPRFISILDLFDDLIASGLISISELFVFSKQDIVIKKSSFLKHFESISFFHNRDADALSQTTLIIREDDLIERLTQRAKSLKENYIDCILNTNERRDFIANNRIESTKKLSLLSIHEFIRKFNLDPTCAKIFYWMDLTDENTVKTLIETKTFVNEYLLGGIYENFLRRVHNILESGIYYISAEKLINLNKQRDTIELNSENICKSDCFLTYQQASILVDFADPDYESKLSSLITIHDIVSNKFDELQTVILPKQQVIDCKTLLDSFYQRIIYRQKRFKRIESLQKLLLSPTLINSFIKLISKFGKEYFTRVDLDYLEDIKLIDIGILAILFTLPTSNGITHLHTSSNYLHILDPTIEKYSIFLTKIIIRIISNRERLENINEILLSNPDFYLSTEELLKICISEHILTNENIQQIFQEISPIDLNSDLYSQYMNLYAHDSDLQHKMEQKMILNIFDYILHFNHRNVINEHLRYLLHGFKSLSIHKAQVLLEKDLTVLKLLFKNRQKQTRLTIADVNRYLDSYPIPCRLDIINELCHSKIISQSLANKYTMDQCYELKLATPESQAIFLCYMMVRLIQKEGYIDEMDIKTNNLSDKYMLRHGFLTVEQISQSTKAFFLQDYLNEDVLKNQFSEHRRVIEEQLLTDLIHREKITDSVLSKYLRRRQVIQMNVLIDQLKYVKISKEKVQRKVDNVLSKFDENTPSTSSKTIRTSSNSIK